MEQAAARPSGRCCPRSSRRSTASTSARPTWRARCTRWTATSTPRGWAQIDERIAALAKEPDDPERARRLNLLQRQRQTIIDLQGRRTQVASHLESCVLAMQNVRFDLLRLRSAGVAAVLGDLTQATQQAKALSRDVDNAIAAAGEIREAMK